MYYAGLQGDICLVMTSTWSKENNFLKLLFQQKM